jgi:type II secretion system protein J
MKTPASMSRRAFTLVEILMALAIFALVLTAIYATWTAILRGSRAGLGAAAQVQRERVAIQTIEQALTSARSFALDLQHYGFVAENGSEAMLSFVARLPKSFPRGGRFGEFDVRRVAFSLEDGPDAQPQLVLRQCPLLMDFDEDEKEYPLVLAKHVKELAFEFWDTRRGDWTDTWGQTNELPKLIRVTLEMSPPSQRVGAALPAEVVTRVIALPSVTVPASWQRPNPQRQPGAPP